MTTTTHHTSLCRGLRRRFTRNVLALLATTSILCSNSFAQPVRADRNDAPPAPVAPAAAAAAAAVATVVITAVAGLVSWVNDQSDDCYAAALGAAWGKDCNLDKEESQDTGWTSTDVVIAEGDNGCANGYGQALAQEDPLGSWAGVSVRPFVVAYTYPLHDGTTDDYHKGRGWAKAGVDGKVKAKTQETPGGPGAPAGSPGAVFATVTIESLDVTTVGRAFSSPDDSAADWSIEAKIDGVTIFSSIGRLDGHGTVTVSGDLPVSMFSPTFDPIDGTWGIHLIDIEHSVQVGTFDASTSDSVELTVELETELNAADTISGGGGGDDTGACCGINEPCSSVTDPADCAALGQTFYPGQTCEEIGGCVEGQSGTCFDPASETCQDGVALINCASGIFTANGNCNSFQWGSCCVALDNGDCVMATEADCVAGGGEYRGHGSSCVDSDGDGYNDDCGTLCEGDVNGDGNVGIDDLIGIILEWGTSNAAADVDNSGTVGVDDLVIVILRWGFCPISNDQCESARLLAGPGSYAFTTVGATLDGDDFACAPGTSEADVFFMLPIPCPLQQLVLSTQGSDPNFNTVMELYMMQLDGTCDNMQLLACDNDSVGAAQSQIVIQLLNPEPNQVLMIRVGGDNFAELGGLLGQGQGLLSIEMQCLQQPPPFNDDCFNAEPLFPGVQVFGTTEAATFDPEASECGAQLSGPGVWYSITGTGNSVTAQTCASGLDTTMHLYAGSCNNLVCIGGDDDGCGGAGGGSSVTWCTEPGAEYMLLVAGWNGASGIFELQVFEEGPCNNGGDSCDCCAGGGTPGCSDPFCMNTVCSIDQFCCDVQWDPVCADMAAELCDCCE